MPHHEESQDQPHRKPSNWWAFEREPWKRVNAEIVARETAGADRERADRALRSAFAFAGAALAMANAPRLAPATGNDGRLPVKSRYLPRQCRQTAGVDDGGHSTSV